MILKIFLFTALTLALNAGLAQQTFSVLTFTVPNGWQQQQNEGGVQLTITDKKSGAYAMAIITKATNTMGTAEDNFSSDWLRLVKSTVQVNGEPLMQQPEKDNGWDIIIGNAGYSDGNKTGTATLITATGGGQSASVVLLTNTVQYQDELLSFISSLKLEKIMQQPASGNTNPTGDNSSVTGLWCDYMLETTGYNINGMPQYTAGYLRKEYAFYPDGTYLFRNKQWLTKTKDILYMYESGTYSIQGNKLILTPKSGKSGFWSKTPSTKEWGKPAKTNDYKPEKRIYTFEKKYTGTKDASLILITDKQGTDATKTESHYFLRDTESLIDNPPGLKTGFENKSFSKATVPSPGNVDVSSLTGIWGQYQGESYAGTGGSSNLTAGYDWREYYFYPDGSYDFLQKSISYLYQQDIVFAWEKGTYQLNGNLLTIIPLQGSTETWSKAGGDKAGKLLKTEKRTLEKIMYQYAFHYFSGIQQTNLVLSFNKTTQRDGAYSTNASFNHSWLYNRPFNPDKPAIELPNGTKFVFNKKSTVAANNPAQSTNTPLAGKIWEGTSTEKFSTGTMKGYNTGGFFTSQYRFNTDGTYRFAYVSASAYQQTNGLQYETGTYTISGNKLTVIPATGFNEEWTVTGGPVKLSGMSAQEIHSIKQQWDKKIKTAKRTLEKFSYTFRIEFMNGNNANALILENNAGGTVREGKGNMAYYFETPSGKTVPLPDGYLNY